jgi:hypothetical protein
MAQKGRGIFMVYVDIDAQHVREFNKWYNEEHLPELLSVPGILSAARYEAVKGGPQYLACYELESVKVMQTPLRDETVVMQEIAHQLDDAEGARRSARSRRSLHRPRLDCRRSGYRGRSNWEVHREQQEIARTLKSNFRFNCCSRRHFLDGRG